MKLKSTHYYIYMITLLGMCIHTNVQAQVVINELMQSNVDCIMDDLNEFPDSWVELYNSGSTTVNLGQYKIGLTPNASEAWQLPSSTLPAHGFTIVYCDKAAREMHTDFRLESGKNGAVYLFHNNAIEDKITGIAKQPAPNIAYGRETDASATWGYQLSPTPRAANSGRIGQDVLGEPIFSEYGRVMTGTQTLSLELSLPDGAPSNTVIRYTTNGSEPTSTSNLYTGPIKFSTTRVIRAKLFCDGYLSPRSTTQSYIFFPRQLTLPVVSIVTDSRYYNDNKIGIYVEGTYSSDANNYQYNWRRPINLEFFEGKDQKSAINQLCETRIQGGATRGNVLKSQAFYAHKRFGIKRFDYEFFPDQRPGVTNYKSFILRNAGNDFDYLYMRDAVIQRTMAQNTDLDWQAWRPAIVYVNGQYKGILNIRERSNEDNIYTNYDGLEDIDMFENWWELKEGDWDNYNRFRNFYAEHNHTLKEYEEWIDWEEFINLMVMNLYYNNQDFPGNNIVMWRPRTEDGRWRFIAKDTDFGLGLYGSPASYRTIEWIYNPNFDGDRSWANQYEHTRLFRRMMEDGDFAREFIDHAAVYMGDFMNERGTRAVWDPMYDIIKTEYPYHRKLINEWWPDYDYELNSARQWIARRTTSFYQQLANYYNLGTPTVMTVNQNVQDADLEDVEILFNNVRLTQGTFDGKFFAGRNIVLEGVSTQRKTIAGWELTETTSNGTTKKTQVAGCRYSFTMPTCKSLSVNAILENVNGIDLLNQKKYAVTMVDRQIMISGLTSGIKIVIYDINGILLYQSIATQQEVQIELPDTQSKFLILKVGAETTKLAL